MADKKQDKIVQKLYNGEVEIEFNPNSHRYKKVGDKKYLVSVTACTGLIDKSAQLKFWAVKLMNQHILEYLDEVSGKTITSEELYPVVEEGSKKHTQKVKEASDVGDYVHNFAHEFAKYKAGVISEAPEIDASFPDEAVSGISAFLEWYNTHKVEFVEAERLVYSREHDVVGTLDAVAIVDDVVTLIDYKTSNGVWTEHYIQTAGYRAMYDEEQEFMGIKAMPQIEKSIILNFGKNGDNAGKFTVYEISEEDSEKDKEAFIHLIPVKRRLKEREAMKYAK